MRRNLKPGIQAILGTIALLAAKSPAPAAEKAGVTVEHVEYHGWKDNLKLSNGKVEALVTLDVGPRILVYKFVGGQNVLFESGDDQGTSGEPGFKFRGGHRLWTSPEDPVRTYMPDNTALKIAPLADGRIRLTAEPDTRHGLQKEIDVKLDDEGTGLTIVHRVKNVGESPIDIASWALTVMKGGGVEIIPLPPKAPHAGKLKNPKAEDFAPNSSLVLWPYADLTDPRLVLGSKFLLLHQKPHTEATKIGLAPGAGWVGYLREDLLFVKRFAHQAGKHYPDRGCNFETYTDGGILEIETLGPLVHLAPNHETEHTERWQLYEVKGDVRSEKDVETLILPRMLP